MAKRRSRSKRGNYYFTPKRRAALKKAQAVSARKRRGKRIAVGAAVLGTAIAGGTIYHKASGSALVVRRSSNKSTVTGSPLPGVVARSGNIGDGASGFHIRYGTRKLSVGYRHGRLNQSRRVVQGTKTKNWIDNSPDMSNNPSRNFSESRVNTAGGAAKSRQINWGHYPVESTTHTSVTDPLSKKIMGELGDKVVFGRRVRR